MRIYRRNLNFELDEMVNRRNKYVSPNNWNWNEKNYWNIRKSPQQRWTMCNNEWKHNKLSELRMEPIRVKKMWNADVWWNSKRRKYILQQIIPLNEWQTRNR